MFFNDLRINDWVLVNKEPVHVVGLNILGGETVTTLRPFMSGSRWYTPNKIKPIPLTEDILLKIGFKQLPSGVSLVKRYEIEDKENGNKAKIWYYPDNIIEIRAEHGQNFNFKTISSLNGLQHVLSDFGFVLEDQYFSAILKTKEPVKNETEH
jgi:hypothetical protein